MLFGYSIVFTEQPLFNEAPADKQIFTVLTLIGGQLLTILANYINKPSSPTTSSFNHCPPMATTIKQEEKLISAIEGKPLVTPATPKPSPFGNPNERPPL